MAQITLDPSVLIPAGPRGTVPNQDIDNVGHRIRFELPDGSWGAWINLPVGATGAAGAAGASGAVGALIGGRLSLDSAVAVTGSDISGASATHVYLVAAETDSEEYYLTSDTSFHNVTFASPLDLALNASIHLVNTNYPVFTAYVAGNLVIGTGPAWTSDTASGTGAGTSDEEIWHGRVVNKNQITLSNGSTTWVVLAREAKLRGGIRIGSVAGQTADTKRQRFVSNLYNAQARFIERIMLDDHFDVADATVRQWNSDTTNQCEWFSIADGRMVEADLRSWVTNQTSATVRIAQAFFGLNSTSAEAANQLTDLIFVTNAASVRGVASYRGVPARGFNKLTMLAQGTAAGAPDVIRFYGTTVVGSNTVTAGLQGKIVN
jgi:hypothetical protein